MLWLVITASAIAFNAVEKVSKGKAIAINVIDPVVDYTCKSKTKAVGIIGTKNTILSKVYAIKIKILNLRLLQNLWQLHYWFQ